MNRLWFLSDFCNLVDLKDFDIFFLRDEGELKEILAENYSTGIEINLGNFETDEMAEQYLAKIYNILLENQKKFAYETNF